jgi:Holliday junction resolvasome RuvABC endonuclease subunit
MSKVLGIDPGRHTGWGLVNGQNYVASGSFTGAGEPFTYMVEMKNMLGSILEGLRYCPDWCVLEGVQVYGDSLKSQTSARRGDLIVLSYLIGVYASVCHDYGIAVRIMTPREWKGQWTKDATAAYVKRTVGLTFKTDHETDAVAMALRTAGDLEDA